MHATRDSITRIDMTGVAPSVAKPTGAAVRPAGGGRRIVFVDGGVAEGAILAAGALPGVDVAWLADDRPALAQIAARLSDGLPVAALHIVAHGRPGALHAAAGVIDAAALRRDGTSVARIAAALAPGAEVVLFACEVAAGPAGRAFVAALSSALRAPVAAAEHVVGAAEMGGPWNLAPLPFGPAAIAAFTGTLAPIYDDSTGNSTITGTSGDDVIDATTTDGATAADSDNDTISAGAGNDTVTAGAGSDLVIGGGGVDVITGGAGDDTISTAQTSGSIDGGTGTDVLTATSSGALNLSAVTISGIETLTFHASGSQFTLTASQINALSTFSGTAGQTNTITLSSGGGQYRPVRQDAQQRHRRHRQRESRHDHRRGRRRYHLRWRQRGPHHRRRRGGRSVRQRRQ
jgi:hypothetical protein